MIWLQYTLFLSGLIRPFQIRKGEKTTSYRELGSSDLFRAKGATIRLSHTISDILHHHDKDAKRNAGLFFATFSQVLHNRSWLREGPLPNFELQPGGQYFAKTGHVESAIFHFFEDLEKCDKYLKSIEVSQTRAGRKVYAGMTKLHEEIRAHLDKFEEIRPRQKVVRDFADGLRRLDATESRLSGLTKTLAKVEDKRLATEIMLDATKRENQKMTTRLDELEAKFDETVARLEAENREVMDSLKSMFNTVLETNKSLMNQPTQTAASDANVAEMLKLLTVLVKDEGKG